MTTLGLGKSWWLRLVPVAACLLAGIAEGNDLVEATRPVAIGNATSPRYDVHWSPALQSWYQSYFAQHPGYQSALLADLEALVPVWRAALPPEGGWSEATAGVAFGAALDALEGFGLLRLLRLAADVDLVAADALAGKIDTQSPVGEIRYDGGEQRAQGKHLPSGDWVESHTSLLRRFPTAMKTVVQVSRDLLTLTASGVEIYQRHADPLHKNGVTLELDYEFGVAPAAPNPQNTAGQARRSASVVFDGGAKISVGWLTAPDDGDRFFFARAQKSRPAGSADGQRTRPAIRGPAIRFVRQYEAVSAHGSAEVVFHRRHF